MESSFERSNVLYVSVEKTEGKAPERLEKSIYNNSAIKYTNILQFKTY